jgi:hypothetical protein
VDRERGFERDVARVLVRWRFGLTAHKRQQKEMEQHRQPECGSE